MKKVLVGMSGGVDSSVTAYLLKKQGYEVEGLSFIMWEPQKGPFAEVCCSLRAIEDVADTARHIGIPHSVIDVRKEFMEKVVKPFVNAYVSGMTPNPCIMCNKFIKFPFLLTKAESKGAHYIATGHYARVDTKFFLKKGIDPKKDQSYVLYVLKQDALKRLILPLGYYRKNDVRKIARELGLPAADRSESQEICFIEERNYSGFIEKFSGITVKPGPIVDSSGKVIGRHKGIYGYTIGQRKGMGISSPEPLYVADIDILKNTICAGDRESARKREFLVEDLNWIMPPPSESFSASVKVRSTMREEPATISLHANPFLPHSAKGEDGQLSGQSVHVVFDEPQWAPAPGQSAVFYDRDRVIGGGIIKKSF